MPQEKLNGKVDRSLERAVSEHKRSIEQPAAPDPELVEKANRRRFTAEYKLRVVREADACFRPGEIGALLRARACARRICDAVAPGREAGRWSARVGASAPIRARPRSRRFGGVPSALRPSWSRRAR